MTTSGCPRLDYGVRLLEQERKRNRLQTDLAGLATEYEDAFCLWTGQRRSGQPNSEHSRNVPGARWNWAMPS